MKVLVTGSSGQLGSFVCEALKDSHQVVGLDLRPQPYDRLKPISVVGDICEPSQVRGVLKGIQAVVHCAAQVSVEESTKDPISDAKVNVLGTVNMLNESVASGVSKFIYVSSAAIFGPPRYVPIDENHPTQPMSNYGASKLAGEKYALAYSKNSAMEVVPVRPFNFYSSRADPKSPYSGVITKFAVRLARGALRRKLRITGYVMAGGGVCSAAEQGHTQAREADFDQGGASGRVYRQARLAHEGKSGHEEGRDRHCGFRQMAR